MNESWRMATAPPFGASYPPPPTYGESIYRAPYPPRLSQRSPLVQPQPQSSSESSFLNPLSLNRGGGLVSGPMAMLGASLENENSRLATRVSELQSDLDRVTRESRDREAHLERENKFLASSMSRLQSDAEEIARDLVNCRTRLTDATRRCDELENRSATDVSRYETDVARMKISDASTIAKLKENNEKVVAEFDVLRQELLASRRTIESMREELKAAARSAADQSDTIKSLSADMARKDPYHLVKQLRDEIIASQTPPPPPASSPAGSRSLSVDMQRELIDKVDALNQRLTFTEAEKRRAEEVQRLAQQKYDEETGALKRQHEMALQKAAAELRQVEAVWKDRLIQEKSEAEKLRAEAAELARRQQQQQPRSLPADDAAVTRLNQQVRELETKLQRSDVAMEEMRAKIQLGVAELRDAKANHTKDVGAERQAYEQKIVDLQKQLREARQQQLAPPTATPPAATERGLPSGATAAAQQSTPLVSGPTLTIVSGKGLLERDGGKDNDHSDPFVIVRDQGKELLRTEVCKDSLDPTWQGEQAAVRLPFTAATPGAIQVEVWNHNTFRNDFLGLATVVIKDLFAFGPDEWEVDLIPRDREADAEVFENAHRLGSIRLRMAGVPEVKPKPPRPARTPRCAPQAVKVTIVSAKGLLQRDDGHTDLSDPFVIVLDCQENEVLRTEVCKDQLDPVWAPDRSTVRLDKLSSSSAGFVRLQVWNWNAIKNEFMGEVQIAPKTLFEYGPNEWELDLKPREREADSLVFDNAHRLGSLRFNVAGIPEVRNKPPPPPRTASRSASDAHNVKLTIRGAKDLLDRDSGKDGDHSDPFVIVLDGQDKEVLRTPVCKDSLNPTWAPDQATVRLPISMATPGSITIQLWNWNMLRNEFLGMAVLSVKDIFAFGPQDGWDLDLQPRERETDSVVFDNAHRLGSVQFSVGAIPDVTPKRTLPAKMPKRAPDTVKITAISAQGLLERDGGGKGDLSDPFVIILDTLGNELLRTAVCDNTVDPKWAADQSTARLALSAATPGAIELQVWNWNALRNDFLGHVTVAVKDLFAYGPQTWELDLLPRDREADSTVLDNAHKLGSIKFGVEGVPEVKTKPPPPARLKKTTAGDSNTVRLTIVSANGLLERDGKGNLSDPYVVVLDGQDKEVLRTPVCKDTLTPTWTADLATVRLPLSAATPGALQLQVWNWNALRNDFLGAAALPIKDVFAYGPQEAWELRLLPREREADAAIVDNAHLLGTIKVSLAGVPEVTPKKTPPPPRPAEAPKEVKLTVRSAKNLLERDGQGKLSDPYVILIDNGGKEVLRTPVCKATLAPSWQADTASVRLPLSATTHATLQLQVWNWNMLRNDFLGMCTLKSADLFAFGPQENWEVTLDPREREADGVILDNSHKLGTITFSVSGVPEVKPPKSAPAAEPRLPPKEVKLSILSASDLLERDGKGKLSDPFAIVLDCQGKEVLRTTVCDNTLDPVWQPDVATVKLALSATTPGSIEIQLWNWNPFRNDFIGSVVVTVADLFAYGPDEWEQSLRPREHEADSVVFENAHRLGKVKLKVAGVPDVAKKPARPPPLPAPVANVLKLTVLGAEGVLNRDKGGSGGDVSDPFVIVIDPQGKEVFRTPVCDNTLDPTWPVDQATGRMELSAATPGSVQLQLWDWNVFRNDFLGCVTVPVKDLFAYGPYDWTMDIAPREKETDAVILDKASQLGTLKFRIGSIPEVTPKPAAPPARRAAPTASDLNNVRFTVVSGRGLLDRDGGGFSGLSDPLVKVIDGQGKEVLITPHKSDTLAPTWDANEASVRIMLSAATPGEVQFEVWDHNKIGSNAFMGVASLKPADIFAAGNGTMELQLRPRSNETDDVVRSNAGKLGTLTVAIAGLPTVTPTPQPTPTSPVPAQAVPGKPQAPVPAAPQTPVRPAPASPQPTSAAAQPTPIAAQPTPAPAATAQPTPTPAAQPRPTPAAAAQPTPTAPAAPPPLPTAASVTLTIASAAGLCNRDGGFSGESDPFVVVTDPSGKEVFKSDTVSDSLNPTWDNTKGKATFTFKASPSAPRLLFSVYDADPLGGTEFLGEATLDLVADAPFAGSAANRGGVVAGGFNGVLLELKLAQRVQEKDKEVLAKKGDLGVLRVKLGDTVPIAAA